MKRLIKNVYAPLCTVILLMSMSTAAFAADSNIDTQEDIYTILKKVNAEYGTNIHILSKNELAECGLTVTTPQAMKTDKAVNLEKTLRYIAEVQIPQFRRRTQEAKGFVTTFNSETSPILNIAPNMIVIKKSIDYATAGVEAYITTDSYGNTVWGINARGICYTDSSQPTWFLAPNPIVSYMDGRKTLLWTGEGDYYANINGTYYYLHSGTQYTTLYVEDYT